MNNQQKRPYLDKICAGPHLMSQRPGIREDTIVLIPTLRHTGIKSELHEQEIPVTTPEGRITRHYKQHTKKRLQPIYRDHQELSHREITFKKGHKQFIDKVLVDMEEKKRAQHERQLKQWRSSKSEIGFAESFNALNWDEVRKNVVKEQERASAEENQPVETATRISPTAREEDDYYGGDADFEPVVDEPRPKSSSKEKRLSIETPLISSTQAVNSPVQHAPTRSASIISTTSSSNPLSPSRKMRPYSRMSLFENMLDTLEPPKSPSKRFGSLADITAAVRDSFDNTNNTQSLKGSFSNANNT